MHRLRQFTHGRFWGNHNCLLYKKWNGFTENWNANGLWSWMLLIYHWQELNVGSLAVNDFVLSKKYLIFIKLCKNLSRALHSDHSSGPDSQVLRNSLRIQQNSLVLCGAPAAKLAIAAERCKPSADQPNRWESLNTGGPCNGKRWIIPGGILMPALSEHLACCKNRRTWSTAWHRIES